MRDPFPFPPPAWLQDLVRPFATYTSLTTLPLHIHELAFATLLYTFVFVVVSPTLSPLLFPKTYPRLSRKTKLSWDVHVVSFVQSVLICALSLYVVLYDDTRRDMNWLEKIHGYSPAIGLTAAFGCGYFLWDFIVTGWNVDVFGVGMLAHAISALTVFALGFRPFLYYYCPTFLLYELSSPFLNIHWFMDKMDMTGSLPQLLNGITLLLAFAGARLAWGTVNSALVYRDVYRAWQHGMVTPELIASDAAAKLPPELSALMRSGTGRWGEVLLHAVGQDVPAWLALSYLASNLVLNGLNWYWFEKMIATLRRRFDPPFGTKRPAADAAKPNGTADLDAQLGRTVYADGRKGVEAEGVQVRKRPAATRSETDILSPVHA